MATAGQLSVMTQAFAKMTQDQQIHNQDMFARVMRAVGTGLQAGVLLTERSLGKVDVHRITEIHRNGWEH